MNKISSTSPTESTLLEEVIKLSDFLPDEIYTYKLDKGQDWVQRLYNELEDGLDETLDDQDKKPIGDLSIELNLLRKIKPPYKDQLIVNGSVIGEYHTPCVRCLIPTPQNLDFSFAVDFVDEAFEKQEEYAEVDSIWENDQELDLYFHRKGKIQISEMIHEQTFINFTPFPLHDENCKGLCTICGINLNTEQCKHEQRHEN